MTGFYNVRDYAAALSEGRAHTCSFRKVPSQASTARWWVDLSMASGNPVPQYYASSPLEASVLNGQRGIYHGEAKDPESKHLAELMLVSPTAALVGAYKLLDYLLFYPFVDLDSLDSQTMVNDTVLPRYTTGAGVRAMLVCVAPTTGGGSASFDYINQDGVAKTSPVFSCSVAAANIASIITSEPATVAGGNLFLPLASGDTGIRSITAWDNVTSAGGLGAVVLVKTIADSVVREINTAEEKAFVQMQAGPPRIYDGAYLGLVMQCASTVAAGILAGRANFAWG